MLSVIAALVFWPRRPSSPHTPAIATRAATQVAIARAYGQPSVQGRHIAGIVVREGVPAAGAAVLLSDPLGRATVRRTTADGRFDFGPQIAAPFTVVAEHPASAPTIELVDLRNPRIAADDLHLVLHPCDASLRGTIRDAAGGTVPHARIGLPLAQVGTTGGAEADDEGAYTLCVPVGWSRVAIAADGYARAIERVEAYGVVRRDFTLVPAATIEGVVLREGDRAPVPNAIVEVRPDNWRGMFTERGTMLRVLADDSGAFHVDAVMPGAYAITARAEGLASPRPAFVFAETGIVGDPVECLVGATQTVRGTVSEENTGAPVVGVEVVLVGARHEPGTGTSAVTQSDGSFALDAVPATYDIFVHRRKLRGERPRVVVTDAAVNVALVVGKGGAIAGTVSRGGKAIVRASVQLRGPSLAVVTTDHAGAYTFDGLEPGEYQIYAESRRLGAFSPGPTVTLVEGERRENVNVELSLAGAIAGIIVDQDGVPVAGAFVRFSLVDGSDFGEATTAEDGRFHARAMSGGGEYAYEVRPSARSEISYSPALGTRFSPVRLADGTSTVSDLRIRIRREQLVLAGRVVDVDGRPVAGARVTITPSMYDGQPLVSDANGAFTATGLPAGTYGVAAAFAGREVKLGDIIAPRRDVVLQFPATGTLEGTFEGFREAPWFVIQAPDGSLVRATIAKTTFRSTQLRPGTYHVSATTSAETARAVVEVRGGAIARVALRATAYGEIAGAVIDEVTRRPLEGINCRVLDESSVDAPPSDVTDDAGAFRITRVSPGELTVLCGRGRATVTVAPGARARVEIVVKPPPPSPPEGTSGVGNEAVP